METIISLPEADISIVADIMEERLRDVPMYRRTLNVGDTVSYFTYFSPVDKERFLLEYPKQVRETPQGLLEITGVIKRADKVREMLDKQCNKYDGRNMYEIAAPGQLGVSGSPVLVKLEDKYFFAGVVVSAGIPGNTFCGFPAYKKSTIIFSGVVNISSLGVVRSEYASK
ncbi:hypothetical protein HYX12_02350 [Candidatus Woesearchaeota archaeon]|nr:hypothetical protein [Candidatus Woesearchaeota archaeon]